MGPLSSSKPPQLAQDGLWLDYVGATLTARAFDTAWDGFGKWLVTIACWLFAYSTMISWIYYGEQGVVYLFGQRYVIGFPGPDLRTDGPGGHALRRDRSRG